MPYNKGIFQGTRRPSNTHCCVVPENGGRSKAERARRVAVVSQPRTGGCPAVLCIQCCRGPSQKSWQPHTGIVHQVGHFLKNLAENFPKFHPRGKRKFDSKKLPIAHASMHLGYFGIFFLRRGNVLRLQSTLKQTVPGAPSALPIPAAV